MRRGQFERPTAANPGALGVLGSGGELAVEEDRDAGVLGHQRRHGERLRARRPAPLLVLVDDRHHVDGPDVRVDALVLAQVDLGDRSPREPDQRLTQFALVAGEREHAAVVVGVGVDVEHARRADRALEALQLCQVAAFAEVGHSHEHGRQYRRCPRLARRIPRRICYNEILIVDRI